MKMRSIPLYMSMGVAAIVLTGCGAVAPAGSVGTTDSDAAAVTVAPRTMGATGVSETGDTSVGSAAPVFGAPDGMWVTNGSSLAMSRDGGDTWQKSSLPGASGPAAVAVLASETITVTGTGSRAVGVSIMPVGKSTWHTDTVSLPDAVGSAEIVQSGGQAVGILVTYQSSAQFSRGQWIADVDGGASWQVRDAPAGGVVSSVGGALWLVGGPSDTDLYRSDDGGLTWQRMGLSGIPSSSALGPIVADGAALVALVVVGGPADGAAVHLLLGDVARASDASSWKLGPTLPVPGSFAPGALPAESVAGEVMWILGGGASVVRVDLASGTSRTVAASGLPIGMGSVDLHAESATAAWFQYSSTTCAASKADCATSTGMLRTTDSGATWRPVPSPLGE